jgi:hypothetical protein
MRISITESQLKKIIEQSDYAMDRRAIRSTKDSQQVNKTIDAAQKAVSVNPHTLATVLAIGTFFIPVAGPFISAAIGLADAGLYYKEGDKSSAGLTAVFSMLPFMKYVPGAKELGSKGMALLAKKLTQGATNLTKAEIEIVNAVKMYTPKIQEELTKMAPKLKSVINELQLHKLNYIKKYGEAEYNKLLAKFLYDGIDQKTFINTLKNVKTPTIKIKPVLGGGRDHRVFQSAVHPDRVIKAELRAGEVDKWYDIFVKNERLFAKTFSKTKVRNTDGTMLSAVVMEKLNTVPFTGMWGTMEKLLLNMPSNTYSTLEYVAKNLKNPGTRKTWNDLLTYVKQQEPSIATKVDEFYKMVDELYKITPNPDIRQFNFGYNKTGVLKVLDI